MQFERVSRRGWIDGIVTMVLETRVLHADAGRPDAPRGFAPAVDRSGQ